MYTEKPEMSEGTLPIRPHHGLCAAFFKGEGYSESFTKNMSGILKMLSDTDPEITITDGGDVICKGCPNFSGGSCSGEKAALYDMSVMKMCDIAVGDKMSWKEFSALAEKRIISAGKLADICGDCMWYYICGQP